MVARWDPARLHELLRARSLTFRSGRARWTARPHRSSRRDVAFQMGGVPVWSPDGSRIAIETEPRGDLPHHYLVVNADGTGEPGEIDELTYRSWLGGSYFCHCYG